MKKTRTIGDWKLVNENEKFSWLDDVYLSPSFADFIEMDRMMCGRIAGPHTTEIVCNGHRFAIRQERAQSNTLYVKKIG